MKVHPSAANRQQSEAWPVFEADEIEAVAEVLASGRVNQWTGTCVKAFEKALAERIGMPYAIALANGSVAIELALKAFGVGPGDEVIVTSRSFIASASAASLVGATPVFADVDPDTQNISPETVAPLITDRTRAIIPVHLAGWPADMPGLMQLAKMHDLFVIEDCAQAIGAEIGGKAIGSFGHAATFSFCQDKIITTGGEGGMALFREEAPYARAWSFKDHGKDFDLVNQPGTGSGFRWLHTSIGTNWRMTEMQAAIGLRQLTKLDGWIAARIRNAKIWADALISSPALRVPMPASRVRHAFYKFYAFVVPARIEQGTDRDQILAAMVDDGIRAFSGSCPEIYLEGAFSDLDVEPLPIARTLGETSLMFEIHPTLDPTRLAATAAKAREVVDRFERRG